MSTDAIQVNRKTADRILEATDKLKTADRILDAADKLFGQLQVKLIHKEIYLLWKIHHSIVLILLVST